MTSAPSLFSAVFLTVALLPGCGCGASSFNANAVATDASKATAAQFWDQYHAEDAFARAIEDRLATPKNSWAMRPGSSDTPFRVRLGVLVHYEFPLVASSVDFTPYVVSAVDHWPRAKSGSDGHLTVVCAYDEANDRSLLSFVWSSLTETKTLDATSRLDIEVRQGARFTGLAIDKERRRIYVADVKNFEVLAIVDTTKDGVPDSVSSVPAVTYPAYCGSLTTGDVPIGIRFLRRGNSEGLLPFYSSTPRPTSIHDKRNRGRDSWKDLDGDGVMDIETVWCPTSTDVFMDIERTMFAGSTTVTVDTPRNAQREIRSTASSPPEVLARFTASTRPQTVTLSRPLAARERITLIGADSIYPKDFETVASVRRPLPISVVPNKCMLDGGPTTLTIVGANLGPATLVQLYSKSNVVATASTLSSQPSSLVVELPNITDPRVIHESLRLEFRNPGSSDRSAAYFFVKVPQESERAAIR